MPIVAFIGPDGAGKTTIIEALRSKWDCDYHKGSYEPPDKMVKTFTKAIAEARPDRLLLCDRLHYPDDIVYSRALRGIPSVLEFVVPLCELVLGVCDTLLIYVSATMDELRRRFTSRGDDFVGSPDYLGSIVREYEAFLSRTSLPWYHLDTTHTSIETAVARVEHAITYSWPELMRRRERNE